MASERAREDIAGVRAWTIPVRWEVAVYRMPLISRVSKARREQVMPLEMERGM